MDDVTVREATGADGPFLLSLAREAYREVLELQFSGWDESIHGGRFAEKIATPDRSCFVRRSKAPAVPVCRFGYTRFDSIVRYGFTSAMVLW
jgi:hypothetical protein